MPARRLASRPWAFSLAVLAAMMALTTACANSTTRARPASGTATPSPTATPALPTSSQVTAYVGAGDHVYALDGHTGAVKWTYVTGHGTAFGGIDNVAVMAGVVFAHGTGATSDGQPTRGLYALDAATGALRWTLQPPVAQAGGPNALGSAEPIAAIAGMVYLFAQGGQVPGGVYAVDLASGKVVWSMNTGSSSVTVDGQAVYVTQALGGSSAQGPMDDVLTALDRTTGAQRWQLHGLGGVALFGDLLYARSFSSPETLSALDTATGAVHWTRPMESQDASLSVIGMTLYMAGQSGVSALDPSTGQERWHYDTPGALSWGTGIDGEGATLCLGYHDQNTEHIVGVDAATGVQRWTHDMSVPSGGTIGFGGFGGGACYARTDRPNAGGSVLSRVDAATGTTTWTVDEGGQEFGAPLSIFADAIYAETSADRMHSTVKALSVADGSTLWQFTPDVDHPSALAVG
jgi:outer membrane protein assembly factor BamB